MRRTRHLFLLAVIVGLSSRSCVTVDRSAERDSALTILFESDDYVLGPARDDYPKFLVFEPLVRGWGSRAAPGLAERGEHSLDLRTWTYHLRNDVRWHDGVPVTARDIQFTLELYRHPDVTFHGFPQLIESITVPDDHTLVLRFYRPVGPAEALAGWPVYYPRHVLEDLNPEDFFDWQFWKQPIGNGPYRYVRGVSNTMVELEANPDYFRGRPPINRIVLRLSTANVVTELLSGNVDAAYYLGPADIPKLASDPRFRVYYQWMFVEPQVVHWNQRYPFLSDPLVRRALSHALDRRELARVLYLPDDVPLIGGLSGDDRARDLYDEGRLDRGFHFDPALAGRLLDQAGWLDHDGDGIRDRDGTPAAFELLARQSGILSTLKPAILMQDHLRAVGVDMEIRQVDPAAWRPRYRSGDFDATIHDIRNNAYDLLREEFFGNGSVIGYRNPGIVGLLEAVLLEVDPASQDSLYASINQILRRDVPVTFLLPYYEAYVAHRKIHGLSTPDRAHPVAAIMEIWIEGAE